MKKSGLAYYFVGGGLPIVVQNQLIGAIALPEPAARGAGPGAPPAAGGGRGGRGGQ